MSYIHGYITTGKAGPIIIMQREPCSWLGYGNELDGSSTHEELMQDLEP